MVNKVKTGSYAREIDDTTERADQSVGEYVCKYGRATSYGCGHINDTSWMPSNTCNPSGCHWNATFVKVGVSDGVRLVDGGDSGGPWFIGKSAYGATVWGLEILTPGGTWIRTDAVSGPFHFLKQVLKFRQESGEVRG